MTIPKFDQQRSDAIYQGLVSLASPRPRRRPWMGIAAIALTSALAGGAVSAAVAVNLRPVIANPAPGPGQTAPPSGVGNPGVAAPEGTTPGMPIISLLGTSVSASITGDKDVPLEPPAGATHVRVTVTCLTPGDTRWGLDPSGNNPGSACDAEDAEVSKPAWMDFALGETSTLFIRAPKTTTSIVSYQFVAQVETAWGVNAHGQTFGVEKPGFGAPDLVATEATNGTLGYVNAQELADVDGTTTAESFDSPQDALDWQESMKGQRISVPVYQSDGVTVVGEFVLQY